ncbi:lipopolysaccharide biosynthesis protein [Sphingomonas sp. PL-96]|uniref:lipopolysaccharide biosynthesis protein n=1 Tax=Sphingomonas sp. PL-96 TaxID=2887201 RepID=UPI001E56A84B|nr:lipopolysaccharide biosynthesis protein [Sphingomonas sp. PL-96]MCC2978166.1 lipopolysaccharide biosynthesis protein [Sphingomonas sp. PL-96]
METPLQAPNQPSESLRRQVRSAILWRSGTQILGQLIAWTSTFVVIRLLSPSDYGLVAMTGVVLLLLSMLNGYGLANAVIQHADVGRREIAQVFGMLLLLNGGLALLQVLAAPLVADYYHEPMVAQLLRVQALLYLPTPFASLAYALLARTMEFRRQAQVNLLSSVAGAIAALVGAYGGLGVWTLVLAPGVLFYTRAIGLTIAARSLMWPSFRFAGAERLARFGGLVAASGLLNFAQSQADVLIAGRWFDAHQVGIYTTALFLTQVFANKFVPPLNEVAFSAYARLHQSGGDMAGAFPGAVRLVMLAAMPFYFGVAAVAEPLVHVMLGPKWLEAVPIVQLLAIAMPCWTLQTLFQPAIDAAGRPGVTAGTTAIGAVLLPVAFLVGARYGIAGIAAAWIVAHPILLAIVAARALPVLGVPPGRYLRAIAPPVLAAAAMALLVFATDGALPVLPPVARLSLLVAVGAVTYLGALVLFAPASVREAIAMVRARG